MKVKEIEAIFKNDIIENMKKTVLVGVTSGIAAFKALELIRELKKEGIEVFVVMTNNASQMVKVKEFEKTSGNKIYSSLFEKGFNYKNVLSSRTVDHIALADKADLMVIVPATANVIGKIAHGIADDFLTTTTLAVTSPILVCPAMNVHMWNNPIVQKNISILKTVGCHVIPPTEGMLACGYTGKGRLENIPVIKEEILRYLNTTGSLKGKKIIVTAGGTIEKIDDVRYVANKSSGKMGIAIAEECFLRGAQVLILRAKNSVSPRYNIPEETFQTTDELSHLVKSTVKNCNVFFHVAAVSDFEVEDVKRGKISSKKSFSLQLKPRTKILDQIKKLNSNAYIIGFKAEFDLSEKDLIRKSRKRLLKSKIDMIVANDVSRKDRGFQSDNNEVFVVTKQKVQKIPLTSKKEVASRLVDFIIAEKKFLV